MVATTDGVLGVEVLEHANLWFFLPSCPTIVWLILDNWSEVKHCHLGLS